MMARISASLACVGGVSTGSFDLGGDRITLKLSRGIMEAVFKMLLRFVPTLIAWGAVS